MLIFLDFDGVLRCDAASPLYGLDPPRLRRFQTTLRELPGADVVIASSWREGFSLVALRGHFADDIRPRIIGATPILLAGTERRRYQEVSAYLKRKEPDGRPWVALDDQREHYPVRDNVRILDSAVGFDEAAAEWLLRMGRRYGACRA